LWKSRTPLETIGVTSGFFGGVTSGFFGGVTSGFFGGVTSGFFGGVTSGFFDGVTSGFFDGVTSGFFFLEGGLDSGEGGTEAGEGGTEAGATIVESKEIEDGAGLLSFFLINNFSISGHMRNTPKMTRTHDIIAAKITGRIIVYMYSI
jgi:hypothetical protein